MSTHHPSFSRSSGLGSVFKSLTKSLKTPKNVPVLINPTVVGGGQDVQMLLQQLQLTTQSTRAAAAAKLSKSLKQFPISSITEVWYLVRNMCHTDNPSNYRQIALELMDECIKKNDTSIAVRLMFFKDIVQYMQTDSLDPEYLLFLRCMNTLTHEGKNIHDFCIYDEKNNIFLFIESTLTIVTELNCQDVELIQTVDFISNCLLHNTNLLHDELISSVIYKVTEIGYKTSDVNITLHLLQLICSTTMFLEPIIEYLCFVYGLHTELEVLELVNQCLEYARHDIPSVVQTICDLVTNPGLQKHRIMSLSLETSSLNSCIGAIQILANTWIQESARASPELEYCAVRINKSCKTLMGYGVPLINTTFLRCFDKLFLKSNYEENFGVTVSSFSLVFPFYMWISSTHTSMFDVLKSLRMNSTQDTSYFQSICHSLQYQYEHQDFPTPKDKLVDFFVFNHMHVSDSTIDFILNYYQEEKLCTMLNPAWENNSAQILNHFYYNTQASADVKIHCLLVIFDAIEISNSIFKSDSVNYELIFAILAETLKATHPAVVEYAIENLFTHVATYLTPFVFDQLCELVKGLFKGQKPKPLSAYKSLVSISSMSYTTSNNTKSALLSECFGNSLGEKTVQLFLKFAIQDGEKAERFFKLLIVMLKYSLQESQIGLQLIISKCMVRIRVTNENHIYFTQPEDMIALSTSFHRYVTDQTFERLDLYQWVYPEVLRYIPDKYLDQPVGKLNLGRQNPLYDEEDDDITSAHTIDISEWLDIVLEVMTEFVDWEVYSFIWAHFCSQLSNLRLFTNCGSQILKLRALICDQLMLNIPSKVEFPPKFTRSDLQVVLVRNLSALLGYHQIFTKYDEDHLINALIFGLESWEKTAIPCINILTVCCYELPLSIKKYLIVILTKLQVRQSGIYISAHLLEFLIALIYLPSLTSNFTIEEFKRVFGIAFKLIQYANDLKRKSEGNDKAEGEILQRHGIDATVEHAPTTQQLGEEISPILIDYILNLSFKVISSWFLKIHMNERKKLSSFLIKNLVLCNLETGQLDEKTLGLLDSIVRYTYCDFPLTIVHSHKSNSGSEISSSHWILGYSIISFETNTTSGDCNVKIRRPTGITKLTIKNEQASSYTKNNHLEVIHSNYYLLQFFNHLEKLLKPIPIVEDSVLLRAMNVLDRIPAVQFHKIGIVYIALGQSKEEEILLNRIGSKSYQSFLENIGDLVKLKGANDKIHVGGLDTENGMDGQYSRYWRDKTTQIIFHITTMMNNESNSNEKMLVDMKKRHIGNNYVNIFYDESGLPLNFNLIKSQFNFLNIVISPHTTTVNRFDEKNRLEKKREPRSGIWEENGLWELNGTTNYEEEQEEDEEDEIEFYKVKTFRRSGVPGVFATCHFKIVSRNNLPILIRNLSITADEFASVWHADSRGGYHSTWSQRVRQIKNLKEKTIKSHDQLREDVSEIVPGIDSRYEYLTEETDKMSEIYSLVEFNSYTC